MVQIRKIGLVVSFWMFMVGAYAAPQDITGSVVGKTAFCEGTAESLEITADYQEPGVTLYYRFLFEGTEVQSLSVDNVYRTNGVTAGLLEIEIYEDDGFGGSTYAQTEQVPIVVNALPALPATLPDVTECAPNTVSIVQPAESGYSFAYYMPDGTTVLPDPTAVSATGTYYVAKIDDASGCESVPASISVTINDRPAMPVLSPVTECAPNTVSIVQPAEAGYSFAYYDTDGITELADASAISASGAYYITKTNDATGCQSEKRTVQATINERPVMPMLYSVSACAPSAASIVQPEETGFTFTYYMPDGMTVVPDASSISVSGTYYVAKTNDATGCMSELAPISVTINERPVLPAIPAVAECAPNTASILQTAEGGYIFAYYMSDGTSILSNPDAISKSATYYVAKINDATGCMSEKMPVSVTINPRPQIPPLDPIEECYPNTADIEQSAEAGYSFIYYDQDASTILSNVSNISVSGVYFIVKMDNTTFCTSEKTPIRVTINELPEFTLPNPDYACTPNTIDIEQAESGFTFKYYNSAKIEITNADAIDVSGTYYVTKQNDQTGCVSDYVPVAVTIVESPVAFAGDDRTVCQNGTTVLGQRGVATQTYHWVPSANLSNVDIANPTATIVEDVEYTLTVTLKAYPRCTSQDVVKITNSVYPKSLLVEGGGAYCENTPPYDTYVELNNAETGIQYALFYNGTQYSQWQPATAGGSVAWTKLEEGTYTVQAKNADGCIEKMQNSVFVQKYTHPTANISSSSINICSGDSIDITIKFFGLAPFAATYKDQYGITHDITSESSVYTFRIAPVVGDEWSIIKVSDARCQHIYEIDERPMVHIDVSEEMTAEILSSDRDNTICFGDQVTLEAKLKRDYLTYKWSTNDTDTLINVHPMQDTTVYYLQVSNNLGCTMTDSITIYVNPLPEVDFTGLEILEEEEVCSNDEPLNMVGTPPGGIFSGPNVIGSVYYPNAAYSRGYDSVMYTYTDEKGCTNRKVRYYYVNPSPNVNWYCPVELGPPTPYKSEYEFCRLINDSLNVQGVPSGGYWTLYKEEQSPATVVSLGGGNAYIKDCMPGTYHLRYTYIDDKGCENSMMKRIIIGSEPPSTLLDMGKILIPDGDTLCSRSERVLIVSTRQDGHFETNDPRLIIEQDSLSGQLWINPSLVNSGKYRVMFFKMDYTNCQHYSWKDFYIFSPRNIEALKIPTTYCVTDEKVEVNFKAAFDFAGEAYIIKNTTDTLVNHFNVPNSETLYFDPTWGVGKYEILLNFEDGTCPNVYRFNIKVLPLPVLDVNLPVRDYCYGDTITFNCLPEGGFYTSESAGLQNNLLFTEEAGLGTHRIVYTYTDTQGGCVDSIAFDVFVHGQAKGSMRILNLNEKYCENVGTTEISGYPIGLGTPYFTETNYLRDLGGGKAEVLFENTNYNSTNIVTFNIQEDYVDYYGNIGSCVNSYQQSFKVLSKTVDFFGYADGEEICGTIDSLLLIGSSKVNAHFEIDVAEAASALQNIDEGKAYIFPSQLQEGWYAVTYYVDYYEDSEDEVFCTVKKTKRFYVKPLKEFEPYIVCSENNNTFAIDNTEADVQYDLWVNGVLFQSLAGNGGTITFNPITEQAYCHFYASRGVCKRTHPDEFYVSPMAISVRSEDVSCYGFSDGEIMAEVQGGVLPHTYNWTDGNSFSASEINLKHLDAAVYTLVVTDAVGCTATKSVEIKEPEKVAVQLVEQKALSCYDSKDAEISVIAEGGTAPYTYTWTQNGSQEVIATGGKLANVASGVYEVHVLDANLCPVTKTFVILDKLPVDVDLVDLTNVEIYGEHTGSIEVEAKGGVSPYTYEWNGVGIENDKKHDQNQQNLPAGTYFLTVRDANECRKDTMFVITQPEKLIVRFTKGDVTCFNGQDGYVALEVEGGVEPYSYVWTSDGVTISTERDATRLSAGVYSVLVTDAAGSEFQNSFRILEADELTLITSGRTDTEISCFGDSTGILSVEPRGGTTPYTYEWIGTGVPAEQKNKATIQNVPAGTYRVIVTDSHNCSIQRDYEIKQPQKLILNGYDITEPTCNGRHDAAVEINPTGGVEPYEFYWEGTNVLPYEQNQTNIAAGVYNVTVTDANDCEVKEEIVIKEPSPLKISLNGNTEICEGSPVDLNFSMNINRQWTIEFTDGNNTYTLNTDESLYKYTVTPTESVVYTLLRAYDQAACQAVIENNMVEVNVHSVPTLTLPQTEYNICAGEPAELEYELTGESPWTILISNGNMLYRKTDIDMSTGYVSLYPETTTTYTVEKVSTPYCAAEIGVPVNVNVHPRTEFNAQAQTSKLCKGDYGQIELTLSGQAPWHVYYTENGREKIVTVQQSPYLLEVAPEETTRYVFTKVESDGACVTSVFKDIQIAVSDLPEAAQVITGKADVCMATQTRYFVPAIPMASRYVWTVPEGFRIINGEGTSQIAVEVTEDAQSGFITVYGENDCGKGESTTLFVSVIPTVGKSVQIIAPDELCVTNELQYIGTVAIDHAERYEWSLPYGFVIQDGEESADLWVSLNPDAVSGTITVSGKNQCGVGEPFSKEISIRQMPKVEAGPNIYTNCKNNTQLSATSVAPYAGTWRVVKGHAVFADAQNPQTEVTELGLGENFLVWEVNNGICTKADTVMVYNNSAPKAEVEISNLHVTCENEVLLRAAEPQIGTGIWECVGGNAEIENPNSNIALATQLDFGKNTFRWTTRNGFCEDYTLVTVQSSSPAKFAFAGRSDTIFVDHYRLNAAALVEGITGEWSVVYGDEATIVDKNAYGTEVTNLSVGRNIFRWTVRSNECTAYSEITILYVKEPIAYFVTDVDTGCQPLDLNITNSTIGNADFEWDFGDGTSSTLFNPRHVYEKAGTYEITLTARGDLKTDIYKKKISVIPPPVIDVSVMQDTLYLPQASLLLINNSAEGEKYFWDFGNGDTSTDRVPKYTYPESGVYDIFYRMEDLNGCADSTKLEQAVLVKAEGFITFPNAFIPNKSMSNGGTFSLEERNHDVFYPVSQGVVEYSLQIFNRWGEEIFSTTDVNVGWDGYLDGKLCPTGAYVYKSSGKFSDGRNFTRSGEVYLIQ